MTKRELLLSSAIAFLPVAAVAQTAVDPVARGLAEYAIAHGGAGSSTLGASAATPQPYRSGETTTGFYSAGSGLNDFSSRGTQTLEVSTTYLNLPQLGQKIMLGGLPVLTQGTYLGSPNHQSMAVGWGAGGALNYATSIRNYYAGTNSGAIDQGNENTCTGAVSCYQHVSGNYISAYGQHAMGNDPNGVADAAFGNDDQRDSAGDNDVDTFGKDAGRMGSPSKSIGMGSGAMAGNASATTITGSPTPGDSISFTFTGSFPQSGITSTYTVQSSDTSTAILAGNIATQLSALNGGQGPVIDPDSSPGEASAFGNVISFDWVGTSTSGANVVVTTSVTGAGTETLTTTGGFGPLGVVALGYESAYGYQAVNPSFLTATGAYSAYSISTGTADNCYGYQACYNLTSGTGNFMGGRKAGYTESTGSSMTILGDLAAEFANASKSIAIGAGVANGTFVAGSGDIFMGGANVDSPSATITNFMNFGNLLEGNLSSTSTPNQPALFLQQVANSVDNFQMQPSVSGSPIILSAVGSDTNINIDIAPAGTGGIVIGTAALTSGAVLDASSDTGFIDLPRGTLSAGAPGGIRYNNLITAVQFYQSGAWTSAGNVASTGTVTANDCAQFVSQYVIADAGGGCGGTISANFGTVSTNPTPRISGDNTSGFYSPAAATAVLEISSVGVDTWTATGENIGAGLALDIGGVNAISFPADAGGAGQSEAFGSGALAGQSSLSATFGNTAGGFQALGSGSLTTAAINNTGYGFQAGYGVHGATGVSAYGYQAAGGNGGHIVGNYLSAFGMDSLLNANGGSGGQSAYGYASASQVTTGVVSCFGYGACKNDTTGGQISAFGHGAMQGTLSVPLTGSGSSAFGDASLGSLQGTAANDTALGANVGTTCQTGSNDTLLGVGADCASATQSNEVNIAGIFFLNSSSVGAPTITCGTSASVDAHANNQSGVVTCGTGGPTSGTLTFAGTGFGTWNHCRAWSRSNATSISYTPSLTSLVFSATSLTSAVIDYECNGV